VAENRDLLEKLERDWRDALCSKDMKKLGALMHPDFVLIGGRSSGPFMLRRDEWLDAISKRQVDNIVFEVREATAVGDMLIGTVHARWRLKYLGRVIEDCVVSTDVWVKHQGEWVSIRRHSTPAPTGECEKLKGE